MYRGWGVSLRFATETRTSAHDAVDDAYRGAERGKKREKGEIVSGGGGGEEGGRRIDEGENRGKE